MGQLVLVRHGQASFGADDYDVLSETGWEQSRVLGRWLREHGVRPDTVVSGAMRRQRETLAALLEGWSSAARSSAGRSSGVETPTGRSSGVETPTGRSSAGRSSAGRSSGVETPTGRSSGVEALPAPQVDPGWDEFDHLSVVAALPDLRPDELDQRSAQRVFEAATARWTAGEDDADYHETWGAFVARVDEALARACTRAGPGSTALVVSSGGPIAAACAALVAPGADAGERAGLWGRFNTQYVNTGLTRVVVGSTGPRLLTYNEHSHLAPDLLTYR